MNSKILGVALFLLGVLALIMFLLLKEYNVTAPIFIIGFSIIAFFSDELLKRK